MTEVLQVIGHVLMACVYLFLAGIVLKFASYFFLLGWSLV